MKILHFPKIFRFGILYPKTVLVVTFLISMVSIFMASKLKIQSDLTALLPQKIESVQSLETLKEHFGGSSYLYITVESDDGRLAGEFSDEFVSRIEKHPSVLYVDFRHPLDYFKKRFWLYFDLQDLQEMERRIDRGLDLEKKGVSSTFSDLMDFADPEDRPDLTFEDIFQKYKRRAGKEFISDDEEGKFLILRVKTKEQSENIDASRKFIADIKGIEKDIKQDTQYRLVEVGYTGNYETKIETVDKLKREMFWVSSLVGLLLIFILLAYFRSLSAAVLVTIPLISSLMWTGALVYLFLGHLNVVTSFGAAILGGLGSDYGIYLLTRYYQEKTAGIGFQACCERAFSFTGKATYGSMVTTVGSFLALLFSSFGVFREFGVVGALGILSTYLAMILMIPAMLTLQERHGWSFKPSLRFKHLLEAGNGFTNSRWFHGLFAPRGVFGGILVVIVLCAASMVSLPTETKISFNDGQMDDQSLPGNKLYERVVDKVNATLNPTVLLVSGVDEEEKLVTEFETRLKSPDAKNMVYNSILGLSTFVPRDQEAKKVILARMRDKVTKLRLILKDGKKSFLESLQHSISAAPIHRADLPVEVRRLFTSPYQKNFFAVYLFPGIDRNSPEGKERYRNGIASLKKELGLHFVTADGNFVISDTINLVRQEAPRGMILVLSFLTVFLFIMIRSVSRALVILIHLVGGLILLSGALWLAHMQLNILNISAISIVLGTGIDSFLHFNQRFDEIGDIMDTVRTKVPAVFVSNLTSIVGLGGLILTSSEGIRSIGWVSVLGLAVITLLAIFIFPRCLASLPQKSS